MYLLLEVTVVGPGFCKSPHLAVGLMGELSRAGCHPLKRLLAGTLSGSWRVRTFHCCSRSQFVQTAHLLSLTGLVLGCTRQGDSHKQLASFYGGPYNTRLTEIHQKRVEILSRKVFLGFGGEPVTRVNLSKCFPFKLSNHPNEIFPKYFYFII